jgi:hypothetical protein
MIQECETEIIMKKRAYASLMILSLLIALAAAPVRAQFSSPLTVKIPFSFVVGDKTMPAGEYTLKPATDAGLRSKLLIRSRDGRQTAIISTNLTQANEVQSKARVTFNRYGDQYFFSQIWMPSTEYGREIPKSDVEARLIASGAKKQTVAIGSDKR